MLVFGNVIAMDEKCPRVKIKIPDMDNFETDWIFVPQLCTVKDKSNNMYELDTLVAAILDDEMKDGVILGALYNDSDICILGDKNIKYIKFEDGTNIIYNKTEHILTADVQGGIVLKSTTSIDMEAPAINMNGEVVGTKNISDKNGSMQQIRDKYNSHTHTCPDGTTSSPSDKM